MNEPIKALLVDDELQARESMRTLLKHYCSYVEVVAEATSVDEAVVSIVQHKPRLVFLDVEMPNKTGFELLNSFQSIDFEIILVTAHDQYAIKAFEVSALDYLLKPVDPERLCLAVNKMTEREANNSQKTRFKAFLQNNSEEGISRLAIPHRGDYDIIELSDVVTIEADRMYSLIAVNATSSSTDRQYTYAKKLSHFEDILQEHPHFHRVHRSWMVNTQYIKTYSKKEHRLILTNDKSVPVSKSYRPQVQQLLGFAPQPVVLSLLGS